MHYIGKKLDFFKVQITRLDGEVIWEKNYKSKPAAELGYFMQVVCKKHVPSLVVLYGPTEVVISFAYVRKDGVLTNWPPLHQLN